MLGNHIEEIKGKYFIAVTTTEYILQLSECKQLENFPDMLSVDPFILE